MTKICYLNFPGTKKNAHDVEKRNFHQKHRYNNSIEWDRWNR